MTLPTSKIFIVLSNMKKFKFSSRNFVEEKLGSKYVEGRSIEFAKSFEESGPGTPIFFILSPGVDPLKDVEALGKKIGFTTDNKNLHNVSLGQVGLFHPWFVLFQLCQRPSQNLTVMKKNAQN